MFREPLQDKVIELRNMAGLALFVIVLCWCNNQTPEPGGFTAPWEFWAL